MARPALRTTLVAAVTAALVGGIAPPLAGGAAPRPAGLPACPPGEPPPAAAPTGVPTLADPAACRARPSRVQPADAGQLPVPQPGYHHLGATTVEQWAGVAGRLEVRDTGVRPDSFDFVAARFLAKQARAGGDGLDWLEVGWAETGWAGGRPSVYAFDSTTMSWRFFDDYRLRDGDRIWLYLQGDAPPVPETWHAWLWWGGRWQLLAASDLPAAGGARLEQYLEIHLDRQAGRGPVAVPPVRVDRVEVAAGAGGPMQPWRRDRVPAVSRQGSGGYCVSWQHRYDAWSAGACPDTVQE